MKYKYVKKCDCCDNQVSQISVPLINTDYAEFVSAKMSKALLPYKLQGALSLVCADDVIAAFNYEYASEEEMKLSEVICDTLYDVANDFYKNQTRNAESWRYEIDLA